VIDLAGVEFFITHLYILPFSFGLYLSHLKTLDVLRMFWVGLWCKMGGMSLSVGIVGLPNQGVKIII